MDEIRLEQTKADVHGWDGLHIYLPGVEEPVMVGIDWYGTENKRLQVLVYDVDRDEPVTAVRYTSEGKVAEIAVGDAITVKSDSADSEWLTERDG